jgi:hypothetical protein
MVGGVPGVGPSAFFFETPDLNEVDAFGRADAPVLSDFLFAVLSVTAIFFLIPALWANARVVFFVGFDLREGMTDAFKRQESCEDKSDEFFAHDTRDSYNQTRAQPVFSSA